MLYGGRKEGSSSFCNYAGGRGVVVPRGEVRGSYGMFEKLLEKIESANDLPHEPPVPDVKSVD